MIPYEVREVLFSVDRVGLVLDGHAVLRDVTVDVKDIVRPGVTQGQVVGILGPSGVGKTQLSRIFSGLQAPSSGSVSLRSSDGTMVRASAGLVGMVAQNYPLLRHRSVLGNLLIAARSSDRSVRMEKCMGLLERFGLSDKASWYPSQLSGGQRQRVAIIQQLLCGSSFVILDEPFTGQDPVMKDRTCDLISQVSLLDERNTIFVVAHDIAAVSSISDTLWMIGRDKDRDGSFVPGARIKHQYDLASMGLAWQPGLSDSPEFARLLREVRGRFLDL